MCVVGCDSVYQIINQTIAAIFTFMRKIRLSNYAVILFLLAGGFIVFLPVKASEELDFPSFDAFWEALMEAEPRH